MLTSPSTYKMSKIFNLFNGLTQLQSGCSTHFNQLIISEIIWWCMYKLKSIFDFAWFEKVKIKLWCNQTVVAIKLLLQLNFCRNQTVAIKLLQTNLKNCHRTISVLIFALLDIGQQLYLRKYLQEKCTKLW